MFRDVELVWDVSHLGRYTYNSERTIEFLKHYFKEEFFIPYKKGGNMGYFDPECYNSFRIEIGDWKGGEWKRNKNGSHIGFKFWNHNGFDGFERNDLLVKMICRPEDRKKRHDDRFYICRRNKELEQGLLFDGEEEVGLRFPKF